MKKTYTLTTERLKLREIRAEDAEIIVRLRSDPEIYQCFLSPHKLTLEEHMRWYTTQYVFDEDRYDWIGEDCLGNAVGVFGAKRLSAAEGEVSYLLDPRYIGMGYAHEAVERIMDFCAESWNVRRVAAVIHKENVKSVLFAEKLGFKISKQSGDFRVYQKELITNEQ
jgi:ribosomal-protein-alanine N-acetyltransferase